MGQVITYSIIYRYVTSTEQKWGEWTSTQYCKDDEFLRSAQFRSEPHQESKFDDTAGNDLNLSCTDGMVLNGHADTWGEWSDFISCPSNTAICGISTLVEPDQGSEDDDTALNAVIFYCCKL